MQRISVHSSNIASIGYGDCQTLEIEFSSGTIYQCANVPYCVYDALMTAKSHGKYFSQYVKDAGYYYTQIR